MWLYATNIFRLFYSPTRTYALHRAQEEQMRKLRAAVLASMKKKAPTSSSATTKSPATTPSKKQAPSHASSARNDRAVASSQSNYHGDNGLRSRERNAERSSRANTSFDRRCIEPIFMAKKSVACTSQHQSHSPAVCTFRSYSAPTCCFPGPKVRSALPPAPPPHTQGQRQRLS